jgi:hypothetical protein
MFTGSGASVDFYFPVDTETVDADARATKDFCGMDWFD